MVGRRTFIKATAAGILGLGAASSSLRRAFAEDRAPYPPALPSGTQQSSSLQTLPGKRPLIKRTFRPPNYETPISYFNEPITEVVPVFETGGLGGGWYRFVGADGADDERNETEV